MGEPISGGWKRSVQYTDAAKWGSGINPIHAYRMGDPRGGPLQAESGMPEGYTPAHLGKSDYIETGPTYWGYSPEDIAGLDSYGIGAVQGEFFHQDDWPDWTEETTETRAQTKWFMRWPWGAGPNYKQAIRLIHTGAWSYDDSMRSTKTPTETVNEGWLNKPASGGLEDGHIPDAEPSDNSQIFVQTSMTQRYKNQNNNRSPGDEPRSPIESRVAPMKIKEYSQGERHYDMFPYQQEIIPRPFEYRTAGIGPVGYMRTNDTFALDTLQRTPPPDPSLGTPDTRLQSNYGYEAEDQGYY